MHVLHLFVLEGAYPGHEVVGFGMGRAYQHILALLKDFAVVLLGTEVVIQLFLREHFIPTSVIADHEESREEEVFCMWVF